MVKLNKNERNLLLYLETCAVDHDGLVHPEKLNDDDRRIMLKWNETGFVFTGRIAFRYAGASNGKCIWCKLSADAFNTVSIIRRHRADQGWKNKNYETAGVSPIEAFREREIEQQNEWDRYWISVCS